MSLDFSKVENNPVPVLREKHDANVAFVIYRNKNKNVVVYSGKVTADGTLNATDPLDVYWIMFEQDGHPREELNLIERNSAYGASVKPGKVAGQHEVTLTSLKDRTITLSIENGKIVGKGTLNGIENCTLERVYVNSTTSWGMPKTFQLFQVRAGANANKSAYLLVILRPPLSSTQWGPGAGSPSTTVRPRARASSSTRGSSSSSASSRWSSSSSSVVVSVVEQEEDRTRLRHPMALALAKATGHCILQRRQNDADKAHITSHKNSTKNAADFMQQTQRVSRVDFSKDNGTGSPDRRPSNPQSLLGRIGGSFSIRRTSKTPDPPIPSGSEDTIPKAPSSLRKRLSRNKLSMRKLSNPLPLGSSGSHRGSVTGSSAELEPGERRPSRALSSAEIEGSMTMERSSSFRHRIATVFPNFIKANNTPKSPTRGRSATTFEEPSYQKRQKLASLSPEYRKKKERRGSVEMRHKRRLSVGKEAHIMFQVSDGNEASVYEVKLKEITLVKRLAFGPLSEVYAAIWRDTKVGVKLLMPREGVTDKLEDAVKNFRREIWVMNALQHPNIVKLIGASLTPSCYVLVMEYMSNGSLYDFLRDEANFFPPPMVTTTALDIADGMRYIHLCGVLQRDLKSKNCLVSENLVVKVADFGLSRFAARAPGEPPYTFVGTPYWAAPEVIRHEPYDYKADVYSYAIVLWELVERHDPYQGLNAFQVPLQVANEGLRPTDFTKPAPLGLEQLMKQCWDTNPDQRPSFEDITETLEKWLTPSGGDGSDLHVATTALETAGDLSMHVERETHGANAGELHRFASSHDANAKVIPIVLSRGQTERAMAVPARRSSAVGMAMLVPRPHSERSLSRGYSNNSAP